MDMEMDAPLLRPTTSTSTHSSSTTSTHHSFNFGHSRPFSTYSSPFSHSKSPTLSPRSSGSSISSTSFTPCSSSQTLDPSCLKSSTTLSRTRSIYTKLNTEVQIMKLKLSLSTRRKKCCGKEGRWVKIEGEGENERRVEMVWRRMDGGQGGMGTGHGDTMGNGREQRSFVTGLGYWGMELKLTWKCIGT
ncbi:hypothetical protein EYC80_005923 [Monilinia laxa]|uniref:Uncharacterized protein n=1 Tax=Monilinia laxa TaxID=61186 RepID=A0A5N6KFJ7_MONLA|nr:hypothetical protein EYC80_005923 [Monilinia laxa]